MGQLTGRNLTIVLVRLRALQVEDSELLQESRISLGGGQHAPPMAAASRVFLPLEAIVRFGAKWVALLPKPSESVSRAETHRQGGGHGDAN